MHLTHASLFSGIGGADLAAESAGFETCAQVEVNPFVSPSSASDSLTQSSLETSEKSGGGDILKACGGRPTVLSGGFPCQPVSLAGKKLGSKDDRWLWPEYSRLIRETKPAWIVAENVAALVSIPEFKQIYADIESEGYEIRVLHLRASDVGAPHVRKRCFIVAHSDGDRLQTSDSLTCGLQKEITRDSGIRGEARISERLPDWEKSPSSFCRVDNGLSARMDRHRLQALGNAIVPRVAFSIFESIAKIERGQIE